MTIAIVALIAALILFIIAASGRVSSSINLTALGLACVTLALLLGH